MYASSQTTRSSLIDASIALLALAASVWHRAFLAPYALFATYALNLSQLPTIALVLAPPILLEIGRAYLTSRRPQLPSSLKTILEEHLLEPHDHKLLRSFVHFKERTAKEIMVPRVDLFSLEASMPLHEAIPLIAREGYSRIPLYSDSLDKVIGVILYKDLLKAVADNALDTPLTALAKPVLYAPENKKIAHLLQEFRTKQIHMAIIVDEYGSTEGVVTIEDVLEELVGEIEDEYDIAGVRPFFESPDGSWIVDAKMTLIDIAEHIGIHIPESPAYETIGGYIYTTAGTIPAKGWRLSHDDFDIEVLSSNERALKKIKLSARR